MLDPATWLHHAQALPVGRSRRVDHDCGDGRTLKVDHKDTGWGSWCWRCNDKAWVPHPEESLEQRRTRLMAQQQAEDAASADLTLPDPKTRDPRLWPLRARVWLYKAGMSNDDIMRAGFYYTEKLDRVVLPVTHNREVVYWQARGFDPLRPKYLNPVVDKRKLVARYGGTTGPHDRQDIFDGRALVLTEDILSGWKVGRVTRTWSLLGTSFPPGLLPEILAERPKVILWLDPDAAGRKAMSRISRQLGAYGLDVSRVNSEADPKLLSQEDIISHLLATQGGHHEP
jgi:hypothetical protein